jgi:hypothetical protein
VTSAFAFIPQATPRHFEIQSRRRRPWTKSRVALTDTFGHGEFSRLIAEYKGGQDGFYQQFKHQPVFKRFAKSFFQLKLIFYKILN